MKARCLDPKFKYVPVADQGDGYLQKRFQAIRDAAEAEARKEAEKRLSKIINMKERR